ncbi:hypothetical protein Pmani_009781 [Petrolisthes manimaculis]|uniref:Uncharacterized protein n=1 Tax=Petrolisthes manimaculis TaxID=1843537 RepID=A0AAE1Q5Q4_9EUCA|nr:hypothetical protein Pmani_009781 [Petrolisthes manimaculis]
MHERVEGERGKSVPPLPASLLSTLTLPDGPVVTPDKSSDLLGNTPTLQFLSRNQHTTGIFFGDLSSSCVYSTKVNKTTTSNTNSPVPA